MDSAYTNRSGSREGIARTKRVHQEILRIGNAFHDRHPWVAKHQDAIGFGLFAASCAGILANAYAYGTGLVGAPLAILVTAILMSILHEIEHDLIHDLYFRERSFAHHLMMAGVYAFRPSTLNPWTRRRIHLHHHKHSGRDSDLEERGITNGERWGVRRFLMLSDNMLALYLRPRDSVQSLRAFVRAQKPESAAAKRAIVLENMLGYFPVGTLYYAAWHAVLAFWAASLVMAVAGRPLVVPPAWQQVVDVASFVAVVLMVPNAIRTFCLHFVSSNMHYFGDVEPGNIVQQTQVWNRWWLAPLHLFCFNFGATHAIHHFAMRDPFYVRQLIAKDVYPVLRENGVRFNDFGTFARANRWTLAPATAREVAGAAR